MVLNRRKDWTLFDHHHDGWEGLWEASKRVNLTSGKEPRVPEPNVITFPCRTLTPIWTGDIDRDSAEVKESGIVGSLRFWYEGLLRSLGIYVCGNGGRDEDCKCAVCELFGKTGEARKFRFSVDGLDRIDLYFQANAPVSRTHGAWLYRTYDGRSLRDFEKGCLWSRGPNGFQMKFHFRVGSRFREYIPMLAALLAEIADKGGTAQKRNRDSDKLSC